MKLLSYLPAVLFTIFYGTIIFLGDIRHLQMSAYCLLFLLYLTAGFLSKGHLHGMIFGFMSGLVLIMMGMQETGQIIKETPFGIILIIYYFILTILIHVRKNRKSHHPL